MTDFHLRWAAFSAWSLLLVACSESPPVFHDIERPLRLSDWQLFTVDANELIPSESSVVFQPNNPLFTDYAHKLRTLWIPQSLQAEIVDDEINYPVGSVLSKTFFYPRTSSTTSTLLTKVADSRLQKINLDENQLIETRLLVRKKDGWDAFPYVWNDEQTEAFLRVAGASKQISLLDQDSTQTTDFTYFVPNENQCAGCHTTVHPDGDMHPLGALFSQLNVDVSDGSASPLEKMIQRGWLNDEQVFPRSESWQDLSASLDDRALAYLNMQCGHCHNPKGAADTSGLILDSSQTLAINRGVCKPPVAAGGGAGDLRYAIVPGQPEESILLYRMRSDKPDEMMPELGRSLIHSEGVDLISRWIAEMSGAC